MLALCRRVIVACLAYSVVDRTAGAENIEMEIHQEIGGMQELAEGFHSDVDDTAVTAGFQHTCVIEQGGSDSFGGPIRCFGLDDYGQASPPEGNFIQVSAGQYHTCAVHEDETVHCWGAPGVGKSPEGLFLQVSAGSFHTCGILKDGTVSCWGMNFQGQGDAPDGKYVQVACGQDATCGLKTTGEIVCWGFKVRGQTEPPKGVQFKQVSASMWKHVCGVTVDGDIRCWGANSGNQAVDQEGDFLQVTTGQQYSCAIRASDRSLHCWGVAVAIPQEDRSLAYELISAGYSHMCGLTESGTVKCWGNNVNGQGDVPVGLVAG